MNYCVLCTHMDGTWKKGSQPLSPICSKESSCPHLLPGKLGQQSTICWTQKASQNFNLFSSSRKFIFPFFISVVWLSWNFVKFFFKHMLKISVFYLEKQNKNIPKKFNLGRSLWIGQESSSRWRLLSQFSVKVLVAPISFRGWVFPR